VTIRIVLADDHPVVLAGLGALLRSEKDFDVVALAENGEAALAAVREHRPDVLILDLRMPIKDGLAVLREIKDARIATRVVVLTAISNGDAVEAVCLGAHGLVLKDATTSQLAQCIREVHAGRPFLDQSVASRAIARLSERQHFAEEQLVLTRRELEVARMAADGMPNKRIASRLAITEGTVKLHLHHVYEKLELSGRMALARYLERHLSS